jgi:PadR family transcriptional regulator, regulatory protein PadR
VVPHCGPAKRRNFGDTFNGQNVAAAGRLYVQVDPTAFVNRSRLRATPASMHSVLAVPDSSSWVCRRKKVQHFLLFSKTKRAIIPVGNLKVRFPMKEKPDVLQGTLALMVLKTLDVLGPQHGYGIARRIEQISGDLLAVNQGTLYPLLLKLEHEGSIASEWGASENNRRARFYRLTGAGRKQLQAETREWEQTAAIIARFFKVKAEDLT